MLIGIDASRAAKKQRTGTENYSRNLIFELAKIDNKNNYCLYVGPDYSGNFDNLGKNFKVKVIPNRKFWTQAGLSYEMLRNSPDTLFVPSHLLPPISAKKSVVTIHDLAWKYFPQAYSSKEIRLQEASIRRAIKKRAEIIVYSKSSKSDLKNYYKISSEKIHFVPMGFRPIETEGNVSSKIKNITDQNYLLFVGRIESKKNLSNLIKAYSLLRSERKIDHKLVLVGKSGFGYELIKREISASKFTADILETGFVGDAELEKLYKNASVFVFPSLFEGFGFPILEAFSAGTPVVTSNISSMPEVAGGGALLVNPEKPFEIAAAISQILNKPALTEKLVRAGKNEVRKYNWEICARETLKILESK